MAVRRIDRALARLSSRAGSASEDQLAPLAARVDALEAMIEGLQDAVDRQARRQDARMDEMAKRLEPGAVARALSDRRKRGISTDSVLAAGGRVAARGRFLLARELARFLLDAALPQGVLAVQLGCRGLPL